MSTLTARVSTARVTTARERVIEAFARLETAARPDAWITLRPLEDCLREAVDVDRRAESGAALPLAGRVFAVKDNIDVAGLPTTAACEPFSYEPTTSATCVQRLVDAGAIPLGKTNMDQFATGLVGTRSPFGAVSSADDPTRVSGGSSSGSAVVVALGLVDFALGTDTAGSGRVPAAFNGIVGIKPTLGLVPVDGVVAACRSYDCVSVFARTVAEAQGPLTVMTGPSPSDRRSRTWPDGARLAAPAAPRVAIPRAGDLAALTPAERAAFRTAIDAMTAGGVTTAEIDLSPFLACARLLYDGALVAERYEAFGAFLEDHAESADPSVLSIVQRARRVTGAEVVRDQDEILRYRLVAAQSLADFDALLLPTTVGHPTFAEVERDPLGANALLGTFTNFVNLLDLCAVSVPNGTANGHHVGVTLVARAFEDQVALDLAFLLGQDAAPGPYPDHGIGLVVFGAHMRGLELNGQLDQVGARFVETVTTAPAYRMHALPGAVARPGVTRATPDGPPGAELAGELWAVPPAGLAELLRTLSDPMTLGPVLLSDGRTVTGFGCALPAGEDITHAGGWRAYRESAS